MVNWNSGLLVWMGAYAVWLHCTPQLRPLFHGWAASSSLSISPSETLNSLRFEGLYQ